MARRISTYQRGAPPCGHSPGSTVQCQRLRDIDIWVEMADGRFDDIFLLPAGRDIYIYMLVLRLPPCRCPRRIETASAWTAPLCIDATDLCIDATVLCTDGVASSSHLDIQRRWLLLLEHVPREQTSRYALVRAWKTTDAHAQNAAQNTTEHCRVKLRTALRELAKGGIK
jgi:hypothetical protein